MSTTHDVYEQWRNAMGHSSDRQTALALGLDPSTITLWKRGRNGSPAVIARMARDLGMDVPTTVIRAHLETVVDLDDRAVWSEIERYSKVSAKPARAASLKLRQKGAQKVSGRPSAKTQGQEV